MCFNHRKIIYLLCLSFFIAVFLRPVEAGFVAPDLMLNTPALTTALSGVRFASQGQDLYAVWQGETLSDRKIYFQRSDNEGATWLAQEIVITQIPAEDQLGQIKISADNTRIYVSWIHSDASAGNSSGVLAISVDRGQTWQQYGIASTGDMDIAHDDEGGICAVWAGDQIYSTCSGDGGLTWTGAVTVNTTGGYIHPKDVQAEPAIAAGGNGRFYVTWTDNRGAPQGERYVYVTRSLDNGMTWETDREIVDFPTNGPWCIMPDIVADKNGHVLVSWVNKIYAGSPGVFRYSISTAYSSNSGATWNGVGVVGPYAIAPKLLVDESTGKFYIFWLNDTNHAYRKVQMSSSSDGAVTWSPAVIVSPHHDVQDVNYHAAVSHNVVAAAWENLEPWPGIYVNYSWNGGTTWLQNEQRTDHPPADETPITRPGVAVSQNGKVITAWEDERDGRKNFYYNQDSVSLKDFVRREAEYILSCQYLGADSSYGAINNVQGDPTWIVPRENAMAILGLLRAAEFLDDDLYRQRAQAAGDYLIRIQQPDGAWANQYVYDEVAEEAKSPTQTAEVMIAFYHLGYKANRYDAMKAGAQYLMSAQDPMNKGGLDDGLVGGGKDSNGNFQTWRWASDNAYAYQALKAAYAWAITAGETTFADQCAQAADRIIDGINTSLRNEPVWHTAVDEWGNPQGNPDLPDGYKHYPNWISYAPQMLDLPVVGLNAAAVGDWIASSFQQDDGASVSYVWEDGLKIRKSPGYSFQSSLSWLDTGHDANVQRAVAWVLSSGLWDEVNGGWVDWVDANSGTSAPEWQRFIDTSFYSISTLTGGYDFNSHKALHLAVPYFMMDEQYYSGAAVAQMILHHMRQGTGAEFLYQYNIVEYVRGTAQTTSDFTADEMDRVLGHFDPYDILVSDQFDIYDSLPGGNLYQGYNFTVNSYNAFSDEYAMEKYMRDLAHWMAYPVTQRAWFLTPRELVLRPNTPAAVPLFGSYDHWAVVTGFKTSGDPAPDPHSNPFNTPAFTVYGFWIHDPSLGGIGRDTYKTADECAQNYFFPVSSSDQYNGMLVHVSEPPPVVSNEIIDIAEPASRLENLEAVLPKGDVDSAKAAVVLKTMAVSVNDDQPVIPQSWRDIVDPVVARKKEVATAFDGKAQGEALFVERLDNADLNYYIVPYGGKEGKKKFLVSGAILLDADGGYFKEASWYEKGEVLLNIDKAAAGRTVLAEILRSCRQSIAVISRYPIIYRQRLVTQVLRSYITRMQKFSKAEYDLVWHPSSATPNPYKPMWRVRVGSDAYYVTQEGKIQPLEKLSVRAPVVRMQQ